MYWSNKASKIYSGYNISRSLKFYQFSYKIPMKKGRRWNNSLIFKRFCFCQRWYVLQYFHLSNEKVQKDLIGHQESIVYRIWASLENPINSLTKYLWKKVRAVITPTFLKRFWFWQPSHVVPYVLLSNAKLQKETDKASRIDSG